MSKEKDLNFIKGFSKISIRGICKELNVDRGNVLNGKASPETTKAVRDALESKISDLNN